MAFGWTTTTGTRTSKPKNESWHIVVKRADLNVEQARTGLLWYETYATTKQKPATLGSRLQSTVGSLNPQKIMEQSTAGLAKITGKQKSTSSTTYEVTGAVGSSRNSQEFYSDRAMLAPASLSPESQEDLTEALETSIINPEELEREDQEDGEFVVVDAADEWHWVDHWVKFLVN